MLKTALLPWMTVQTAQKLTDDPSTVRYIEGLNSADRSIEKLFQSTSPYRYHPALKHFLVTRAREIFSNKGLALLLNRTALILEEEGQTDAAINLLGLTNDLKTITGLIIKNASALYARGSWELLEKWIKSIPEDKVRKNPWLLYWMATCRLPFNAAKKCRSRSLSVRPHPVQTCCMAHGKSRYTGRPGTALLDFALIKF